MKNLLNEKGEPFAKVLDYDGYDFPNNLGGQPDVDVAKFLSGLNELTFKDGEVCVVSYPKSGTHWTYEICSMLKNGNSDFINTMVPCFDYSPKEALKVVHNSNGVYTSHLYPRHMPKHFMEKRCKIIHVYRNPKDVVVSYFPFTQKLVFYNTVEMCFPEFLRHFVNGNVPCGGWVQYIEEWKRFQKENPDYPLLEISYEEMKKNLKETVQRMSDFLDLDSPPELIEEIAGKCDFEIMSSHKNANLPQEMSKITNKENSHIFYRKGEVGDWKKHFTVAENEAFDKSFKPQLAELGLNITYEL